MLLFTLVFGGIIAYSGYNIYLYYEAPVVSGTIEKLGTTWTGGTWTCTVAYKWQDTDYKAEIWYNVENDVGDVINVHINENDPETPYSTFKSKLYIIVCAFLELLNVVVCVKKIKNVNRGIILR